MSLPRAREHLAQLKRGAPCREVHTRLLLAALLDEVERQAEALARLSSAPASPPPCPHCAERYTWARGEKVAE